MNEVDHKAVVHCHLFRETMLKSGISEVHYDGSLQTTPTSTQAVPPRHG